jgi:hypothetical protein
MGFYLTIGAFWVFHYIIYPLSNNILQLYLSLLELS